MPTSSEPTTSIGDLIRKRQRELNQRIAAMELAAVQDNGGCIPHTEVNAINDELRFLLLLSYAWLRQLEAVNDA